jgi:glycosyltransferase involved in cell wall biosynthesis
MNDARPAVAIVVQRYGLEVNGGAERLARMMAERLVEEVDLTVLTTRALDYHTWADHYPSGETSVNGVRVERFGVPQPRSARRFAQASRAAYADPANPALAHDWMREQGPWSPDLFAHLRDRGSEYTAIIFVTYLYASTAIGVSLVADRAIVVPTMHDEPPLRLSIFDEVFAAARFFLFLTPEERELALARFDIREADTLLAGVGYDPIPSADPHRFKSAYGIDRPYVLYVGRLDLSKGVGDLVDAHKQYRAIATHELDLVLVGGGELRLPQAPWLHAVGYVSEDAKHEALAGAEVVIVPSPYESLGFSQLEAWAHGKPTLANAASPVLVGQSRRSGGGLWYRDADEYVEMLSFLAKAQPLRRALGAQGLAYVGRENSWDRATEAWLAAIERVGEPRIVESSVNQRDASMHATARAAGARSSAIERSANGSL